MNHVMILVLFASLFCISVLGLYDEASWNKASDFLLEGYNNDINPCEDFSKMACSKWNERKDAIGNWSQLFWHYEYIFKKVIESVEGIDRADKKTPKFKLSVKDFFEQCTAKNTAKSLKQNFKDLYMALTKVMGSPPLMSGDDYVKEKFLKQDFWTILGKMHREIPAASIFFVPEVRTVESDCYGKSAILYFRPKFLAQNTFDGDPIIDDSEQMAKLLNITLDPKLLKEKVGKMVDFQNDLIDLFNSTELTDWIAKTAAAQAPGSGSQAEFNIDQMITLDTLEEFNPNISWSSYFQGLLSPEQFTNWNQSNAMISIDVPDFFTQLDNVLSAHDKETAFNYVFYNAYKSLFDVVVYKEKGDVNSTAIDCAEVVIKTFKTATARILMDHNNFEAFEWRYDLTLMMESIFASFRFLVMGSDWLDDEDKVTLIDKVNGMTFDSGIPDWFYNDTEIDARTIAYRHDDSVIENALSKMRQNFDRQLDYVFGLRDANSDAEPTLEINAYYRAMRLVMFLGYAFPPFYHPRYPLALKYGHIGYVLGHELMHGFDAARIREVPSYAKKWLTEKALSIFDQKRDCVIKQYSSFCFQQQKQCISGTRTVTENMADIDGLKVAFMAYKFALETTGDEPPIPGFTEMSPEQLFFLSAARTRCTTGGDIQFFLDANKAGDPHSHDQARVDIPFKNFPAFAKYFKCAVGSRYAPVKTCSLLGSFNSGNKAARRV